MSLTLEFHNPHQTNSHGCEANFYSFFHQQMCKKSEIFQVSLLNDAIFIVKTTVLSLTIVAESRLSFPRMRKKWMVKPF